MVRGWGAWQLPPAYEHLRSPASRAQASKWSETCSFHRVQTPVNFCG
jgi:hypothetical protein